MCKSAHNRSRRASAIPVQAHRQIALGVETAESDVKIGLEHGERQPVDLVRLHRDALPVDGDRAAAQITPFGSITARVACVNRQRTECAIIHNLRGLRAVWRAA